MKWILLVIAVMFCTMALACGGCLIAGKSMIDSATAERDRLEALKSPEQKAKEAKERKIQQDIGKLERKTRDFMLSRLKSPEGAKFELKTSHVKGYVAYVEGKVTSANAFNARLTKYMKATWTRTNLAKSFDLSALEFEGDTFRNKEEIASAFAASEADNNVQPK